jgi:hypothetical protein
MSGTILGVDGPPLNVKRLARSPRREGLRGHHHRLGHGGARRTNRGDESDWVGGRRFTFTLPLSQGQEARTLH